MLSLISLNVDVQARDFLSEEPREVHKVYSNGGGAAVHLGRANRKLVGNVMVMVKCKDPQGKGWPFGWHVWFIVPGEAYKDLKCECLDPPSGSKSTGANTRAW